MTRFEDLLRRTTPAKAIYFFGIDRLPLEFFDTFSFDQCIEVYKETNKSSIRYQWEDIRELMSKRVLELASAHQDYRELVMVHKTIFQQQSAVLKEIQNLQNLQFEDWFWIHRQADSGSTLKAFALKQASELAESVEELISVYEVTNLKLDVAKDVYERIRKKTECIPAPEPPFLTNES